MKVRRTCRAIYCGSCTELQQHCHESKPPVLLPLVTEGLELTLTPYTFLCMHQYNINYGGENDRDVIKNDNVLSDVFRKK